MQSSVLMQTALRFYGTTGLGCKIGLPSAGAKINGIIAFKHMRTSLLNHSLFCRPF